MLEDTKSGVPCFYIYFQELAQECNIEAMPTFLLYKGGSKVNIVVKVDNIQHFYYIKEGVNVNIVVKVDNIQHFYIR
jgi:hypothetical protein